MPVETWSRYFALDTRDASFVARTMYAAWKAGTAVIFLLDAEKTAQVLFVLDVPRPESLRAIVQDNATDLLGIQELPDRPQIFGVNLGSFSADSLRIADILET